MEIIVWEVKSKLTGLKDRMSQLSACHAYTGNVRTFLFIATTFYILIMLLGQVCFMYCDCMKINNTARSKRSTQKFLCQCIMIRIC